MPKEDPATWEWRTVKEGFLEEVMCWLQSRVEGDCAKEESEIVHEGEQQKQRPGEQVPYDRGVCGAWIWGRRGFSTGGKRGCFHPRGSLGSSDPKRTEQCVQVMQNRQSQGICEKNMEWGHGCLDAGLQLCLLALAVRCLLLTPTLVITPVIIIVEATIY